jgi:3-oxoacyl-(acyl-carrier-protein) synthase
MLGAAGSVELVVSVLSLQNGLIPPTGNLQSQDPECALDVVTAPRALPLNCVLSNSAGFGGCNAAVVLTRPPSSVLCLLPANSRTLELAHFRTSPAPVLISGLGVISALGSDAEETASALQEGEPALFPLSRFVLPEAAEPPLVGEAPDPDLAACGVSPKPYLDRASQLFFAACGMAFQRAGLTAEGLAALEAGVMSGTAWGCMGTAELFFSDYILKGPRLVKPFLFPHAYSNTAVSLAAMEWSLKGPHENAASAATASGIALIEAFDLVRAGQSRLITAGGVDALSATVLRARAADGLTTPPGEAAAVLVLESELSAAARGATPLGRLLGCGLSVTPQAAAEAALAQAGLASASLAAVYVNAAAHTAAESLFAGCKLVTPEALCGDVQGAATALHLAFALLAEHSGPVMILTAEKHTCVALVVARV